MKYFSVVLASLSLLIILLDTRKVQSASAPGVYQNNSANTPKTTAKKQVTVKKQPTSSVQPLLIDRIYEQQRN